MKKILLLGATGSIGQSTFQLVDKNPDKFRIVGASAHSNTEALEALAVKYDILETFTTNISAKDRMIRFQEVLG